VNMKMKRSAWCLLLLCLSWIVTAPVLQGEEVTPQEMELWNQVKNSTDIRELEIYLETYPQGHFGAQAVKRKWVLTASTANIDTIEAYITANPHSPFLNDAVEAIWKLVDRSGDVSLIETFILKYPNSPFARVAEVRLKRMTEQRIWEKAKAANSIDALKAYLADHPQSR